MKKATTLLLILSILTLPLQSQTIPEPPPQKDNVLVFGCLVLVVGAVAIYGMVSLCKKIPAVDPPPQPPVAPPVLVPPQYVNTNFFNTNTISAHRMEALRMPEKALMQTANFQMVTLQMQWSANMRDWDSMYFVTNWLSDDLHIAVCSDASGHAVRTNFTKVYGTNEAVLVDMSDLTPPAVEARKFYRMVELK
jgi:hypothetical protein